MRYLSVTSPRHFFGHVVLSNIHLVSKCLRQILLCQYKIFRKSLPKSLLKFFLQFHSLILFHLNSMTSLMEEIGKIPISPGKKNQGSPKNSTTFELRSSCTWECLWIDGHLEKRNAALDRLGSQPWLVRWGSLPHLFLNWSLKLPNAWYGDKLTSCWLQGIITTC